MSVGIKNSTYVIIMAGGVGSRFWPVSREKLPKQFLDIMNTGESLLVSTVNRFKEICPRENIWIVTNERYRDIVKEQLPDFTDEQILGEPIGRNTAPCIAYAAYRLKNKDPKAKMVVAPSDHVIFNKEEFTRVIKEALQFTDNSDNIVTIGIKPHKPETGYGYIQFVEDESELKKVKTFTEKPEKELAETFLKSGDFVWNAGIFVWSLDCILKNFEEFLPEVAENFIEINDAYFTDEEVEAINRTYSHTKPISVDYGIMEKAENVHVIPADFGWSDVGSWASLHEIATKDENNNLIEANALLFDTENCIIKGPEDELIVVDGLKDYLVVKHDNSILVCKKDNERNFRKIFAEIKKQKGTDYL